MKNWTTAWLNALGYQAEGVRVYRRPGTAAPAHAYGREIDALLGPLSDECGTAVVDVEQVPTVLFVEPGGALNPRWLAMLRQRVWNQSLISLVLVVNKDRLIPAAAIPSPENGTSIPITESSSTGAYSFVDVATGGIQQRHPDWFDMDRRVDRVLLSNLGMALSQLLKAGLSQSQAQLTLGQALFVSYLEHRDIVGEYYREKHHVSSLHALIQQKNPAGLKRLFSALKRDFNGDFLEGEGTARVEWESLTDLAYEVLSNFLARVDLTTGQSDFWNYDFRYIPVELLSGIYETFIGDNKRKLGAYYTPRHLANFAVDMAFLHSPKVQEEVVYDGACGSGILLTTAFRRMLRAKEQKAKSTLPFNDRIALLLKAIRGSDISEAACRVTAFSLYLALLEDIDPSDIARLRDDEEIKLPKLLRHILYYGAESGDFFSPSNRIAVRASSEVTIALSNPPWGEAKGGDLPNFEQWTQQQKLKLPHRQIAAAFAHKALHTTLPEGRVCLILPVKLFASDSSREFLVQWLSRIKVERIVNLSDLRHLLFPTAVHPCVVVVGTVRSKKEWGRIPANELLDIWHAKADVSLAFGRLTIHGTDRHRVPSANLADDPEVFRFTTWGIAADRALIGRLRLLGTFGDLCRGSTAPWLLVKGFNQTRHSSEALDPRPLRRMRFLDTRSIDRNLPVLDSDVLQPFPKDITSVVSYGSREGAAFEGARILFPDGASEEFRAYTVFTREPFCFRHTLAAMRGPDEDEALLRFASVYLRSSLAAYGLLHTAYALVTERERVALQEIEALPFCRPERAPHPKRAHAIVKQVARATETLERKSILERESYWQSVQPEMDALIFEYFGITESEVPLIAEATTSVIPSVQPSGYQHIRTPLSHSVNRNDIEKYVTRLMSELARWRKVMGGTGALKIRCSIPPTFGTGTTGIVSLSLTGESETAVIKTSSIITERITQLLSTAGVWPLQATESISLSSDFLVHEGRRLHLVKPLVRRLWLERQAVDDVRRIIESIRA